MKNFTEEDIIKYMKKRAGYATDGDLHLEFIPKEAEAYAKLHTTIKLMLHQGRLIKTTEGYKLKQGV